MIGFIGLVSLQFKQQKYIILQIVQNNDMPQNAVRKTYRF